MTIIGGFDVHRKQITFDYLDTDTGLVRCGEIPSGHPQNTAGLAGRALPGRRCGDGGGGLHRVAVCGRGARGGGWYGASG